MSLDTESRQFVGHCGAPRQQLFPARNICSASIFPGTGPFGGIQFSLAPLNATILKSGGRGASSLSSGVLQGRAGYAGAAAVACTCAEPRPAHMLVAEPAAIVAARAFRRQHRQFHFAINTSLPEYVINFRVEACGAPCRRGERPWRLQEGLYCGSERPRCWLQSFLQPGAAICGFSHPAVGTQHA